MIDRHHDQRGLSIGARRQAQIDRHFHNNDDVLVVDNLSTGYRRNLNPAARLEEIDIATDSERLTSALHGREVVFLTAAMPRVPRSIEDAGNPDAQPA